MKKICILLSLLTVLLCGCRQNTTVILPPESTAAQTHPATETASPQTEVPSETVTDPSETTTAVPEPTLEPEPQGNSKVSEPTADSVSEPTAAPTTAPATPEPTDVPADPLMEPTEASTSEPITEPPTAPATEPPTVPVTEPAAKDVYDISTYETGSLEHKILTEINTRRSAAGLAPLSADDMLCALSTIRAYEFTQKQSHTRPDGRDCFSVLTDYSYDKWTTLGENLLYATSTISVAEMVDAWMDSEGHRANILSEDFTHAGIGVWYQNGLIYVANLFAG